MTTEPQDLTKPQKPITPAEGVGSGRLLNIKRNRIVSRARRGVFPFGLGLFVILLIFVSGAKAAAVGMGFSPAENALAANPQVPERDQECLVCHTGGTLEGRFDDQTVLSLSVEMNGDHDSSHAGTTLNCIACHTNLDLEEHRLDAINEYPECYAEEGGSVIVTCSALQAEMAYADARTFTLVQNEACAACHLEQETLALAADNVHMRMLEQGNFYAPVCVDCHGSHVVPAVGDPRTQIAHICEDCHLAVFSSYRSSVHGEALEEIANPDVPTCIDCHGVHDIHGPRDVSFREESVFICGGCHGDQALMDKYNISTEVFSTYLADIHGRTDFSVKLNQELDEENKPVCFDCHGIHNIRKTDDPLSAVSEENIRTTCMQCHDYVAAEFPAIWLSHFPPSLGKYPGWALAYWIIRIVVTVGLGGYLLLIVWNEGARMWAKRRSKLGEG